MNDDFAGQRLLKALKATAGGNSSELSLPVGCPAKALLRVVATTEGRLNPRDVQCLTEWRNRFVSSFLTEFEATEQRTSSWLVTTVGPNSNKILFMVDDLGGIPFGYMGIDFIDWKLGRGEADAIVRGGPAPRGHMALALQTLMNFAREQLGLPTLGVRVRSDNTALRFYRKFGFVEAERVPLRSELQDGDMRWVEDPIAPLGTPHLVRMRLPTSGGEK